MIWAYGTDPRLCDAQSLSSKKAADKSTEHYNWADKLSKRRTCAINDLAATGHSL
jgi:hypothetical protein